MAKCSLTLVVLSATLLGGCSSGEHLAVAEAQIPHFRELMAAQKFKEIYETATDDFRKAGTEDAMVSFFGGLSHKLGSVKDSERTGWNVNFRPDGTYVTLAFKTRFEHGDGDETFVYRVEDKDAALVGYNVNSSALITN